MIIEEIKNIKSTKKDLRKFGITIGIVLTLIGAFIWWHGKDYKMYFIVFSILVILTGIFFPVVLKPAQKVWMTFAIVLGWFMTRLILTILFYIVFTITSGIARLFRKRFLNIAIDNNLESYWIRREDRPFDEKDYERQF
jgi:hypothetical protein